MPSLDAARHNPPLCPLSTKASIQVNATRAGLGDRQQHKDLGTAGTFSRRLQLGPGLVPPSSWSLSPCMALRSIHARNRRKVQVLARSISFLADLREILRSVSRPGVASSIQSRKCVRMIHAGSRSESVRRSGSPGSGSADPSRSSHVVRRRHARLVGEGAAGVVGPCTRSRRSAEVGQSR